LIDGLLFEVSDELKKQFYSEISKCPPSINLLFKTLDFYKVNQILVIEIITFRNRFSMESLQSKTS